MMFINPGFKQKNNPARAPIINRRHDVKLIYNVPCYGAGRQESQLLYSGSIIGNPSTKNPLKMPVRKISRS